MSIINQALKKAQRERQRAQSGPALASPASTAAVAPRRRGQALWIVTAALFALSLGATLHAWLTSPTADVESTSRPDRLVAAPLPQPQSVQPAMDAATGSKPARQPVGAAAIQRPAQPRTAGVAPVSPVQGIAARRPTPPATAADYTARGNTLYRQGEYHRAIDMYEAALALNPLAVKARNNLGSAYLQLTMDDRAAAAFEEALRLDESYSLAYYNLACVQARAGNVNGAAAYLRQAAAIEPQARDWARTDSDFARVRNAPEFRQLLEP